MDNILLQENLDGILTAISIIFAILTWVVSFSRDRKARRMEHTADVIANISINDRLAKANFVMFRIINPNEIISVEDLDIETERHILAILDYYE
jgi:hypothetical protein